MPKIDLNAELKNKLQKAKKIGIMGGAFDPIHYGHLAAAECARCEKNLDIVLFIPTGHPPHKDNITFSEFRYHMALLATSSNPHFYTTRMELDRPGPSYTVDTLRILKEEIIPSDAELFFIIGADEKLQLPTWKGASELPSLCSWLTVTRPGYEVEGAITIPGLDISGTALRARIRSNEPVKYLITPEVERYIHELDIYHNDQYEAMHDAVSSKMSEKRYKHTLGVIEMAIALAIKYNVNLRSTYLSALLHDYAKELNMAEKRALCKEYEIPLDEIQDKNIGLMHGPLSAEMAKREFNIEDSEVLEAISCHTTGRAGMGTLAKIIKIADNAEPNRPDYPGLAQIRELSATSLNKATAASIRRDIGYTKEKGLTIHPWGYEALEDLEKENI